MLNDRPDNAGPDDVRLAQVLVPYLEDRADKLPSAEQARISGRHIGAFFGGCKISEITPKRQREFIRWLAEEKGHSPGTISRVMSVLSASLGRARKEGWLYAVPQIILSKHEIAELIDAPASLKHRRLSVDELAAFLDAIPEKRSEHVFRFAMIGMNTLARPGAVCDLSPFQIEHDVGLVHLNPPGRRQTKKVRPTVPMTNCLAAWLRVWDAPGGRFVHYHGKPVANTKRAVRMTAIRAGLLDKDEWGEDRAVTPYTFRRSMARLLRARGVPMADTAAMLGHKMRGFDTTEIYADADPRYLQEVRGAIDDIMAELDMKVSGPRRVMPGPRLRAVDGERR